MRRLAVLTRDDLIGADDIAAMLGVQPEPADTTDGDIAAAIRMRLARLARDDRGALEDGTLYDRIIGEVERPLIEIMLARHGHNQLQTARALGINRNTLRKKLDEMNISW